MPPTPLAARSSPFLILPIDTYAIKRERIAIFELNEIFRNLNDAGSTDLFSPLFGISQEPSCYSGLGTVSDSMTLIVDLGLIAAKYPAETRISSIEGLTESGVRKALQAFDPLWNELFPAEQSRIIEFLVERVDVLTDRVDIKLRIAGVTSLIGELTGNPVTQRNAA